ncbi:MAG: hypothetical protein CVV10_02915 [Gammaproteobacteria bacterium HGW-Gammaproteobacteria-14]|jgi:hypothetical protein|nr:MAG: hypothetical protein CVV10_02915 [Gammaproteobacteria bacterium HGW-Gammaproteobacteria-14]
MIKVLDAVRSVLESTVKSGTVRVENIHNLVVDYARGFVDNEDKEVDRDSIYQLVRDITAEIGGFADDVLDVAEDARDTVKDSAPKISKE